MYPRCEGVLTSPRSIAINEVEKLEKTEGGTICVCYGNIRFSEAMCVRDVLHSLVTQIVERHQDVISLVEPLCARHKREGTRPSQQELERLLSEIAELGKRFIFFLDALDELIPSERKPLIDVLSRVDARLFITSRPLETLQRSFPDAQFFEIAPKPSDINLLVERAMEQNPDLCELIQGTACSKEFVKQIIREKSGGM